MLTNLTVRNFKMFSEVDIELGERVVFVGPNNSGKTSALQALDLWWVGVQRWVEKRGEKPVPRETDGVTINRIDLHAVPVPSSNQLWRDLHVREGYREEGTQKTRNVLIEIEVKGVDKGVEWTTGLEFDYANEESLYCRPKLGPDGTRAGIPAAAAAVQVAYLPPMLGGVASNETRLYEGAIAVRVGEGRTAEVLRNLCWQARQGSPEHWQRIVANIDKLFGVALEDPQYVKERGEIAMSFRNHDGVNLDLSASGRGQQQTLLLLAHMAANPGAVLLLDEPDAHLEILRQRQIYQVLADQARETNSQIIAASHSEVILNEAADRDLVVAFVGKPHRVDDRGSQVLKALRELGFEQYMQAEETGWVLYVEGSTDLAILHAFAERLEHPARRLLERPFVHYVANQPALARRHFYGLREAKHDLVGFALFDRLDESLQADPSLTEAMWRRREVENYLCQQSTLLAFAADRGRQAQGDLFASSWRSAMEQAIAEIASALAALGKPGPQSPDLKASDDFLDPLFRKFYEKLKLPNLMRKTDYHTLAPFVPAGELDAEISEKLDQILEVGQRRHPRDD